jgi:hypothetical protein
VANTNSPAARPVGPSWGPAAASTAPSPSFLAPFLDYTQNITFLWVVCFLGLVVLFVLGNNLQCFVGVLGGVGERILQKTYHGDDEDGGKGLRRVGEGDIAKRGKIPPARARS